MTREDNVTEQPTPELEPELAREKYRAELAIWQRKQELQIDRMAADATALDVPPGQALTIRQRMAQARQLAVSGLVPAGWQKWAKGTHPTDAQVEATAAGIVLGQEWGAHLGFEGLAALQHLQVIEGNIGLKPASARGMALARGFTVEDEVERSAFGFHVKHTARLSRGTVTYEADFSIGDALQARLISEILYDEAGEPRAVVARSDKGKPLPWELYTADMLLARATGRLFRRYGSDIIGGMEVLAEEIVAHSPPIVQEAVRRTLERVRAEREPAPEPDATRTAAKPEPEPYDPAADLEFLGGMLKIPAGQSVPWWEHAGANVRKRTKVQMAADRVDRWVQDNPAEAVAAGLVTPPEDVVTAEIVEDGEAQDFLANPPADPLPPFHPTEEREWPPPLAEPRDGPSRAPGLIDVPLPDWPLADAVAEAGAVSRSRYEEAHGPIPPRLTVAELLAEIDDMAEQAGKPRNAFMLRWVAAHRKNPEDATPDELLDFIRSRQEAQ